MTSILLRLFAVLSVLTAVGIAMAQARTAVYGTIAERIWENNDYSPSRILHALDDTSMLSPALACATGTVVDRAAIALRVLDNALIVHGDIDIAAALPIASKAVDDGLACRPLSAQLWLGRFWVQALAEGFHPALRGSYDRAIATAPYDGWMMRLRTQVGSRWFYALNSDEQRKFFEDLRYTVDMGFLDDAFVAVERNSNQPDLLKREIDQWPKGTRNRFGQFLLSKGVDLKLAIDLQLKPWQHY